MCIHGITMLVTGARVLRSPDPVRALQPAAEHLVGRMPARPIGLEPREACVLQRRSQPDHRFPATIQGDY